MAYGEHCAIKGVAISHLMLAKMVLYKGLALYNVKLTIRILINVEKKNPHVFSNEIQ